MGRSTTQRKYRLTLAAAAAAAFTLTALVTRPAPARAADDPKGVAFFEEKIRPILAQSCVGCHGEEKQKGGLRIDTRAALIKGAEEDGKVTKVVEPGSPEKSMIIEAVEYKNEDIQMPPPKKKVPQKLSDAQITALKEWVKMGVPYGEKPVAAAPKADK
jgi:mono/diheme cytochrome c family protein